jgi:hypothetical protein
MDTLMLIAFGLVALGAVIRLILFFTARPDEAHSKSAP